jgi:hypothetical protein
MLARIQAALYRGDADAAWGLLSELEFIRRRSYLRRVQVMPALAIRCLEDATDRFDRADMKLYAAAARHRIGALREDERGRETGREADAWMAAQNIRSPAAITHMLARGFERALRPLAI